MNTLEVTESKLAKLTSYSKIIVKAGSSGVLPGTPKTIEALQALRAETDELLKALEAKPETKK